MNQILKILLFVSLICYEPINAQNIIPLERTIKIKLLAKDTNFISCYNTYSFVRIDKLFKTKGRFIILKSADNFQDKKEVEIQLCRIIQLKYEDLNLRGCSIYNGISIDDKSYNFNPDKPNVILTVCENDGIKQHTN